MVRWEIWRTRHNEVEDGMSMVEDGMRASNSAAKVNTDCIGKNYLLSLVIIITIVVNQRSVPAQKCIVMIIV